jgi:hypothetical protein
MSLAEEKIGLQVRRIQKIYLFLLIVGILYFIGLVLGRGNGTLKTELEPSAMFFATAVTYFGLRLGRQWVVHLILILSAFGLVNTLLSATEQPSNFAMLLIKALGFLFGLPCAYQVVFFSRKEVKVFFNDKGLTLFGWL